MRLFIHTSLLNTKKRAWSAAFLFAGVILTATPFVRPVVGFLREHHLLLLTVTALFFLSFTYIFLYFIQQVRLSKRAYGAIFFLLFLTAMLTFKERMIEERIHLLEFALLSLLFYKACWHTFKKPILLFGLPFLLATLLGCIDETWQGILPDRFFDVRDIFDNMLGAFIGTGLAFIRNLFGNFNQNP
ncbi:MAG: VanZ family protein [Deltaproteobacteria bacterium]|nr:VanZ family protein [Deltaproteobacteria bacterium]